MLPQGLNSWPGNSRGTLLVGAWQCLVSKNHQPHMQPYLPKEDVILDPKQKNTVLYQIFIPKKKHSKNKYYMTGCFEGRFKGRSDARSYHHDSFRWEIGMLVDLIHDMVGSKSRKTGTKGQSPKWEEFQQVLNCYPLSGGKCFCWPHCSIVFIRFAIVVWSLMIEDLGIYMDLWDFLASSHSPFWFGDLLS